MARATLGLAEEKLLSLHFRRFGRKLLGVEFSVQAQPGSWREVEQFLHLGHKVDLAPPLQRIDPLGRGRYLVAVEIGALLFEFGKILDGF